ncbi:glycosyltransferase [Gordonia hankookensis]|uniref:Glycosyltransferase n=1 Tax=Gordonia hankookensis TaxID=589403 RepID=A0ABR7WB66_9ACTN|nr:glycosyltransferase [Gordonia hankookensis]MBD1319032.1 glycosyltransferase [Gordonia hankookensis]
MTQRGREVIVVLGGTTFDDHQLYDQRIARVLADRADIVFVEPARTIGRPHWRPTVGTRENGRLTVFSPVRAPFGGWWPSSVINGPLIAVQIWAFVLRGRAPRGGLRYLVIGIHPSAWALLPKGRSVFLILDDYLAASALLGMSVRRIRNEFKRMMRHADRVVVVSPHLQQQVLKRGVRSTVVPAGCLLPAPAAPVSGARSDRPVAVFIGLLSDRIDFGLMDCLVDDGFDVLFVGPVQETFSKMGEWLALSRKDGFIRFEPRRDEALNDIIRQADIGLIPYADTEFNQSSFPLKTFEYLACGKPVLSSALSSMRWLDSDVVVTASGVEEYRRAARDLYARTQDPEVAERCRALASQNTWEKRGEAFAELFELPRPTAAR